MENNHWVSCWGTATSISDRKISTYAKNVTLRYPVFIPFSGTQLRLRFSNLTGTEPITLTTVYLDSVRVLQNVVIPAGQEFDSEPIDFAVEAGQTVRVSIYLGEVTQMNAGTFVKGPLSKFQYAYGNYAGAETFPLDLSRYTQWIYFLNTIDILTSKENKCVICYGDSLTAQSWPDYLAQICWKEGRRDLAVIRRGVSGTRILRQYDNITYQAYGLKGSTRFPIETRVSGCETIIIQQGANDIIHPVGTDVNPFRPWSDMPTLQELQDGLHHIYVDYARKLGLKVIGGTLLPFGKWRTYTDEREAFRLQFNEWLMQTPILDDCIDFARSVADETQPRFFADGCDSGDHLHPSEQGYEAMARVAFQKLARTGITTPNGAKNTESKISRLTDKTGA